VITTWFILTWLPVSVAHRGGDAFFDRTGEGAARDKN
jgi:hypothetical protein